MTMDQGDKMTGSWDDLERIIRDEQREGRGRKTTYELPETLRREVDIERAYAGQSAKGFVIDALMAEVRKRRHDRT